MQPTYAVIRYRRLSQAAQDHVVATETGVWEDAVAKLEREATTHGRRHAALVSDHGGVWIWAPVQVEPVRVMGAKSIPSRPRLHLSVFGLEAA